MNLTDRGNTLKDEIEPNNFMKKSLLYLKSISREDANKNKLKEPQPELNSVFIDAIKSKEVI